MIEVVTKLITQSAVIGGGIAGLWKFYEAVNEYLKRGALERYEIVTQLQKQLKEDPALVSVCASLESDSNSTPGAQVSFAERRQFLIFFEHIALLTHTNLIHRDVSEYMFGYYAAMCLDNETFWKDIPKNRQYWGVFLTYAEEMKVAILGNMLQYKNLRF